MTGSALAPTRSAAGPLAGPALLLSGFVAAVVLRVALGGADVARSGRAGLVFAAVLAALAVAARRPTAERDRGLRWGVGSAVGLAGAAVLCVPALLHRLGEFGTVAQRPGAGFAGWAVVVALVATAEEVFLRGTLYRYLQPLGKPMAIGVPALAFALLHLPLYGWGALPLDLAVGVWLGALRALSGTVTAPALAHVLADWAAWTLA
jgi:membrane protease YdiL (CAAX protease family)